MIEYKEVMEGEETDQGYEKIIWDDGDVSYKFNGKLHREDGPAIIKADGYQAWCINGKFHRVDGPAITYSSGGQYWYINGQSHREDGPAKIDSNGVKSYFLHGEPVIPENYHLFSPLQLAKLGLI